MFKMFGAIFLLLIATACDSEPEIAPYQVYLGQLNGSDFECAEKVTQRTADQQKLTIEKAEKKALQAPKNGVLKFATYIFSPDGESMLVNVLAKDDIVSIITYRIAGLSEEKPNRLGLQIEKNISDQCGIKFQRVDYDEL